MDDDVILGMRLKCLELAAAALINGKIHHYDAPVLAREYFDFLLGGDPACDCEVPPELTAARKH